MTDRKPQNDQATHESGNRSAEHASSDAQRFVGSRNRTVAEAEVAPQERESEQAEKKEKALRRDPAEG